MCGSPRRNDDGARAVNSASSSPSRSMPTSVLSLPIGCRSSPGIGFSGVRSSRPGSSWPPLRQWMSVGLHAVFVLQHAAHPDHRGDLVLGQADALAAQVVRLADAGIGAHIDAGVAEQPRHERRDADIVRRAGRHGADIARERQLGDLELLEAEGAKEDFLRIERQVVDGAALDLHAAVLDRLGAVVIAARNPAGDISGSTPGVSAGHQGIWFGLPFRLRRRAPRR